MTDIPPSSLLPDRPQINWKEAKGAFETIKPLSERGLVIVAAAQLDERLKSILKSFFADVPQVADKVFKDTGALSTFYARIEIALLLGLISEKEHRILHLIRKIRNDFSHNSDELSFSKSPIREKCTAFDSRPILGSPSGLDTPRDKFLCAVQFVYLVLVYREQGSKHRELPLPILEEEIKSWFESLEAAERSKS